MPVRVCEPVHVRVRVANRLPRHLDGVVRDDTLHRGRAGAIHDSPLISEQVSAITDNLRGTLDDVERDREAARSRLREDDEAFDLLLSIRMRVYDIFLRHRESLLGTARRLVERDDENPAVRLSGGSPSVALLRNNVYRAIVGDDTRRSHPRRCGHGWAGARLDHLRPLQGSQYANFALER